jgi:hypothetical protein
LKWAALFLGELRDGLTMINMQSAFLIVSKNYTEKQAGVLFFGMSLFHVFVFSFCASIQEQGKRITILLLPHPDRIHIFSLLFYFACLYLLLKQPY